MAVQVSYPGVYIEEFAPGAPIQGVSTSIAAFIGLAKKGELDKPTKITSWDQFVATFGEQPVDGTYLWHAVRGFFDNGGQACYVVRASNGTYSRGALQNRDQLAEDLVRVKARKPGATPPAALQVQVTPVNLVQNASLYQPQGQAGTITARTMTLADAGEAAQFRPGDWVDVGGTRAQVARVTGATITLDRSPGVAAPAAVRLADVRAGDQTLRILPANPLPQDTLVSGSVLTITHNGTSETGVATSVQAEYLQTNPATTTYRIALREGLQNAIDMTNPATVQSEEIDFQVLQGATGSPYTGLGLDPAHERYYVTKVNHEDSLVELELIEPPPTAPLPDALPAAQQVNITGGTDENLSSISLLDYLEALDKLREIDEVTLVAAPGVMNPADPALMPALQQALIAHCELMGDRFAVLDSIPGVPMFGDPSVEAQRRSIDSTRGYAALYYPWLKTLSAATGKELLVPPSGHVMGIMARVDNARGVHKAPANENVNGAIGVQTTMSNQEQGLLNLQGINVIRVFQPGGRPKVWGARTTATDRNWQYVNIRRLFLYLEESIQEGIEWAVFEPNNLQLWQKLRRSITEFLTRVWRDGALFGATAKDAFYVRIDEALNPFSEQALGRLHIEVGVRPTYPAEFIIVRIGIWPGGSEVAEV
ncbi:MAG: phage tail sheath subtilisin-like domain-containing protein [Anaerolineae bacterium]|nr:phage tail sheath subtilisin-like domain-containing protein [Anaerolineae bacterium]